MSKTVETLGSVVGIIGVLMCLGAGVVRVTGGHWLFGFEAFTLFLGGIGVMMVACLLQVQAIALKLNQ